MRLFGFLDITTRDLFVKVGDVSGIGPKIALAIVGHMPLNALFLAIEREEVNVITRIPGIGKKSAERLIVELKDRLSMFSSTRNTETHPEKTHPLLDDALSALCNLGYQKAAAKRALQKACDGEEIKQTDQGLATLITKALKQI